MRGVVAELQSALLAAVLAFGLTLAGWGVWSALPAVRRSSRLRPVGRLMVSLVVLSALTVAGVASWPGFAPSIDRVVGPDETLDTPPWLLGDERQRAGLTPWLLPDPETAPPAPDVPSRRSEGDVGQPSAGAFPIGALDAVSGGRGPSGTSGSTPSGSSDDGRPPTYQGPTAPSDDPSPDPAPSPTPSPSSEPSPEPSPEPTPSPDPEPEEPNEPCKGKACVPCEDGAAAKPKPCLDLGMVDLSL